jgi:chorismate mutase
MAFEDRKFKERLAKLKKEINSKPEISGTDKEFLDALKRRQRLIAKKAVLTKQISYWDTVLDPHLK